MKTQLDIIDRLALGLSGALVLVGIVGLGILEILAGQPYGAAPLTNDAGEVIATPAVDPVVRTAVVLIGFGILLLWGVYRAIEADVESERERSGVTAD